MSATPQESVGARLVHQLKALDVDTIFGIPGSHNLPIFDGIAQSGVRLVNPRHEQGAGFAADGYARSSGRPGVFVTTTGPGILNAATALATAYADSVPVLAISPGARIADEGRELGWLHESRDQHGSLAGLVRSIRPRSEQALYEAVAEIFARWGVERTRPVHLDVPIDLLAAPAESVPPAPPTLSCPAPDPDAIARAVQALSTASAPVIVAGGGAVRARDEVMALSRALGAPIATTRAAAGLRVGGDLPTTVLPYAPEVLLEADLLLVIGSELSQRDVPSSVARRLPRMVRFDVEAGRLATDRPGDLSLQSDAVLGARALLAGLSAANVVPRPGVLARQRGFAEAIERAYPGPLVSFHRELAEALPEHVVITGDSSQVSYLGTGSHFPFEEPRSFLYPDAFAPLGYGLPAAIGAKLAQPERPVVALVGDGAFLFSVQELSAAVAHEIPIVVVVVENGGYLEIEQEMEQAGVPPIGVRFAYPDPVAVAVAFGAQGTRVSSAEEIGAWARRAEAGQVRGPVVLALAESQL